jgi:hypothetical protein
MRSFAKFLTIAAACIVGSATLAHAAGTGSVFNVQVGQILVCNFVGNISVTANGQTYQGTVTGSGTFQVTSFANFDPTKPNSRNIVSYVPVAIQASSTFAGLGTITTRLDPQAPPATSSTTSINAGPNPFPASSAMTYNAITTVNGTSYTSRGVVNFVSPQVFTAFPFQQEPFQIAAPVVFANGDNIGFTLNSLNSVFNN